MAYYDERLKELHTQKSQKAHLQNMKAELEKQCEEFSKKVVELEKAKAKEQADVEKLERTSIKGLFYQLAGNKEEKLSQEKQEAYAAAMKYDTAVRELEGIEADLRYCVEKLERLAECETEYETLFEKKKNDIKNSTNPKASEVLQLEEKLTALEQEVKELDEAIAVGERAKAIAQNIVTELTEADDLADWDLFMDNAFVDISKHEHIHSAQSLIGDLQSELRRFKTELADVQIQGNIQIEMDDFSEFADWFFDNIFTDWDIKDKIESSLNEAKETEGEIAETLRLLYDMREKRIVAEQEKKEQIEKIVLQV